MLKDESINEQIKQTQEEYYKKNRKHNFFKNNQKLDCAKEVAAKVDLQQMIIMTAMIIPGTNKLYFNYPVFKTYGHPDNCRKIYDHFHSLVEKVVNDHGSFEMHINLSTFTVSACTRYQDMITSSFDENTHLTNKMTSMNVYHTPNVIEQITKLLYNSIKHLAKITKFYKKNESDNMIQELFKHL